AIPDYAGESPIKTDEKVDNGLLPDFKQNLEPLSTYLGLAEANRLELKSLHESIKLNESRLKAAYGNIFPNPNIAFGKSTQGNVPIGPKVTAVFFTLNVAAPMTDTNQGNIAKYKATAKQLRFELLSQKNKITAEVSQAYQKLLAYREKLRSYQESILADSFQVVRLARRSYEVGQSDITATLIAQQTNTQTRIAYLEALSNYQNAFTSLEQACGIPLQ
ncbi:MAG: TolC family protein, partial [Candidatus Obscuribacterales bacterium]|nr:TolC family protein [Candidatus Obscuribacterales bacterium]